MALEIKVPTVGESISEVVLAQWVKKEGEYVEMDDVLCELESEKATFELNAEASGILHHIAAEGSTLAIGDLVCTIDTEADAATASAPAPAEKGKPDASSAATGIEKTGKTSEMVVPTVGESITEVTIGQWIKKTGDYVEMDEPIAEIESEKATFELTAEAAGILEIVAEEGTTLSIGALLCKIEETSGAPATAKAESPASSPSISSSGSATGHAQGHPSPAAAKILSEKGISATQVQGTGVGGRITKEDAQKAQKSAQTITPQTTLVEENKTAVPAGERSEERKKMTQLRKTIARRLVAAKNETAMLTTFNEVDMKPIMDIRKKYKDQFKEKYDVNLGFMSFFTKAACVALKEWPAVNALIDEDEIIYHNFVDISIAVSAPKGLVVPVIRNAEQMSFQGIEKKIVELATKARDNKLSIEEMTGGTFTITNGGIFGSMLSTPIINAPQSAILGMHNIVERPVAINGEVVIRPMMYVALSYDHRIIDGRESVSFLVRLKQLLEDPTRLLLEI